MKSEVFPVGLRLSGLRVLVVGKGGPAEERVRALLEAGARVVAVSEAPTEGLRGLSQRGGVDLHERPFSEGDLTGCMLAVLTDLDPVLAARMDAATGACSTFFCAVDQPAFGSFSHLAIARAGDVLVAVSTNGRAPALARRLREELERVLAASRIVAFVEKLAALRDATPSEDRKRVLGKAVADVRITGELVLPEE
ncbi:MAG TPA: NAD(P)-dependent oxidoreductase [Polyangiaceae bacterium]|nr:NAD(P)-dependent oxidoreductase [Polyangiaceae bacterium]